MILSKLKILKWAAVAALIVALVAAAYFTGRAHEEAQAAKQRQEAVEKAVRAAQEEYEAREAEVRRVEAGLRKRAEKASNRLSEALSEIDQLKGRESECLTADQLRFYNRF